MPTRCNKNMHEAKTAPYWNILYIYHTSPTQNGPQHVTRPRVCNSRSKMHQYWKLQCLQTENNKALRQDQDLKDDIEAAPRQNCKTEPRPGLYLGDRERGEPRQTAFQTEARSRTEEIYLKACVELESASRWLHHCNGLYCTRTRVFRLVYANFRFHSNTQKFAISDAEYCNTASATRRRHSHVYSRLHPATFRLRTQRNY